MTEPSPPGDERLRAMFRALHEADDPPAPAYAPLVHGAPAAAGGPAWPRRAGGVLARAAALALFASVVLLGLRTRWHRAPSDEDVIRLAASVSAWQAPTDFLLTTPGSDFFRSTPRLGTGAGTLAGDPTDLIQTMEVSR